MGRRPPSFEYVFASATRRETLLAVATEEECTRRSAVERLDASESAIYDAFAGLAEHGLIVRDGDHWITTGAGRAIADRLEQCRRLDETLLESVQYWRTHALDPLPRSIRDGLLVASTVSIESCDDGRVDRRLTSVLDGCRTGGVLTGTVSSSVLDGLVHVSDSRLVCGPAAFEGERPRVTSEFDAALDGRPSGSRSPECAGSGVTGPGETSADESATTRRRTERRTSRFRSKTDASESSSTENAAAKEPVDRQVSVRWLDDPPAYTMVVTDEAAGFVLPPLERASTDAVLVVEDGAVVARCWRHFEREWQRANPDSRSHPSIGRSQARPPER